MVSQTPIPPNGKQVIFPVAHVRTAEGAGEDIVDGENPDEGGNGAVCCIWCEVGTEVFQGGRGWWL